MKVKEVRYRERRFLNEWKLAVRTINPKKEEAWLVEFMSEAIESYSTTVFNISVVNSCQRKKARWNAPEQNRKSARAGL
jgi:hypothetical protein